MMLPAFLQRQALIVGWLTASASTASIHFRNLSPTSVCYAVETSSGTIPTDTTCNTLKGIHVTSHQNLTLTTSADFNGAITDIRNWTQGARHEINFAGAGITWYDIDYEMGISNSTLGPADGRSRTDGGLSLSGEKNCLAKANQAWHMTENKAQLARHYYYLEQGAHGHGNLTGLKMDKMAPVEVIEFLQLEANLTAYVSHGSVAKEKRDVADLIDAAVEGIRVHTSSKAATRKAAMDSAADKKSWQVDTQDMEITAY